LNECVADKSTATSKNLTRRANHRHNFNVARIKPAPGNRSRAFSIGIRAFCSRRKNLTRRANHRHIFIIASIEPAPGNRPRAF
jgi:hypothetical protein